MDKGGSVKDFSLGLFEDFFVVFVIFDFKKIIGFFFFGIKFIFGVFVLDFIIVVFDCFLDMIVVSLVDSVNFFVWLEENLGDVCFRWGLYFGEFIKGLE